jgi:hypothetical protein
MSVTVDHEPLAVRELGLQTIGQVISHLQRDNRLVVQVLIDGQEPEPNQFPSLRQTSTLDHTIFIETADPRQLALQVLHDIDEQLPEAERLKNHSAELLQKNQPGRALEHLGGCLRIWQHAQESVLKVSELLRINLATVKSDGKLLERFVAEFAAQLKQIKSALEQRDFVLLSDVLLYETTQTTPSWSAAVAELRRIIQSLT